MATILVIEDNADTRNLIKIKLAKAGHQVLTAEDGQTGLAIAFREKPHLVILDVMLPQLDGYSVARRLRQAAVTRQVAILMLTAKGEMADKVMGFEAGADDYLVKPFDPGELDLRVRTLLQRVEHLGPAGSDVRRGQLISVFSLRGGVGKTSLAVNLAVTLGQLWDKPVPLFDLALQSGHVAIFLGLRPKATLDDLVEHWKDCSDAAALADYFSARDNLVRVIAAPQQPAGAERISPDMIRHLIELVRADSTFMVADLSSRMDDQTLSVLDLSDTILLMLTPEVASVQTTVKTLDTFHLLDYAKSKIHIVLNHLFARRALTAAQIEQAIGLPIALDLPYDPDYFVHSVNAGQPYVLLNPTSPGTRALQDFAFMLSRTEMVPDAEPTPLAKAVRARARSK